MSALGHMPIILEGDESPLIDIQQDRIDEGGMFPKKRGAGPAQHDQTLRASNCKNLLRKLLLMQLPVSGGKSMQ